ncbi:regulatory protein RecX [Actinokineospora globicatena]|uniref:regulatory protein RecX n=1 Tax=Actinokineospora globicatena TaxID=103729 RepID=UPI0027E2A5C3|nr:regulatory protein RecX [Actinokineospora globicatena]MCP2302566.1 SOS response regulatory protein OraA/RecX, interacts with RecA [Actinokineospora globicatena]
MGTSRRGAEGSGESTVESARASGKVWESAVPSADSTAVDLAREQLAALRERAAARPSPEVGPGPDGGAPDHGADERQPRRRAKAEPVELSRDEWAAKARDICYRQLAARDRTRLELAQVLRRKEIPDDIAEVVLGKFDAAGLINDAAFAESWVRSRHTHRGLGRRALATELRRKGVDDEVVAEAVAAVDADAEQERAADLVAKKLGAMRALDEQTKIRRLVAMLARRGYGEGMAYRVVRAALDGVDPAD